MHKFTLRYEPHAIPILSPMLFIPSLYSSFFNLLVDIQYYRILSIDRHVTCIIMCTIDKLSNYSVLRLCYKQHNCIVLFYASEYRGIALYCYCSALLLSFFYVI